MALRANCRPFDALIRTKSGDFACKQACPPANQKRVVTSYQQSRNSFLINEGAMIKVLTSGDSSYAARYLAEVISKTDGFVIDGVFSSGKDAIRLARSKKPDLVVLDINLPESDKATHAILKQSPTRIVLLSSSWDADELDATFEALKSGALTVIERPENLSDGKSKGTSTELIRTLRLASQVPVSVIRNGEIRRRSTEGHGSDAMAKLLRERGISNDIKLIAMGASIGGIPALHEILSRLSADFPFPLLVVPGVPAGFLMGLEGWLRRAIKMPVSVPSYGDVAKSSHIYLAPDNQHMGITGTGNIELRQDPPINENRPSISYLFGSAFGAFKNGTAAILLTYTGEDGVKELNPINDSGGLSIVLDLGNPTGRKTPREVIGIESATLALQPHQIAELLPLLAKKPEKANGKQNIQVKSGSAQANTRAAVTGDPTSTGHGQFHSASVVPLAIGLVIALMVSFLILQNMRTNSNKLTRDGSGDATGRPAQQKAGVRENTKLTSLPQRTSTGRSGPDAATVRERNRNHPDESTPAGNFGHQPSKKENGRRSGAAGEIGQEAGNPSDRGTAGEEGKPRAATGHMSGGTKELFASLPEGAGKNAGENLSEVEKTEMGQGRNDGRGANGYAGRGIRPGDQAETSQARSDRP